jgi:hypothetical protein
MEKRPELTEGEACSHANLSGFGSETDRSRQGIEPEDRAVAVSDAVERVPAAEHLEVLTVTHRGPKLVD